MSEIDDLEDLVGTPPDSRSWHEHRTKRRLAERCINGHLYDAANTTFITKAGRRTRRCKACARATSGYKGIYNKEKK